MDRARTEFMEFREVQFCALTFVLAEAIFRKARAEFSHDRIARNFCYHARGRNRVNLAQILAQFGTALSRRPSTFTALFSRRSILCRPTGCRASDRGRGLTLYPVRCECRTATAVLLDQLGLF